MADRKPVGPSDWLAPTKAEQREIDRLNGVTRVDFHGNPVAVEEEKEDTWECSACGATHKQPLHAPGCPLAPTEEEECATCLCKEDGCPGTLCEPEPEAPTESDCTLGRYFSTGAYRDTDAGKSDYEGFLSPLVIEAFGAYMDKHRLQSDGNLRASDNWQQGIPRDQYMKSAWRHFVDLWKEHRGLESRDGMDEALGGLLFNIMGYWHEYLKGVK